MGNLAQNRPQMHSLSNFIRSCVLRLCLLFILSQILTSISLIFLSNTDITTISTTLVFILLMLFFYVDMLRQLCHALRWLTDWQQLGNYWILKKKKCWTVISHNRLKSLKVKSTNKIEFMYSATWPYFLFLKVKD